jgi:hypothetical protein
VCGLNRPLVCYASFRAHCIECHGVNPDDQNRYFFFDLERGTLTLLPVNERRAGDRFYASTGTRSTATSRHPSRRIATGT